ncbi:Cna B-type domain-containing protein [Alloscardovia venturai]|uniref:Cna B-type domain-containing protein n=1 Tax=Alloscardovia venturai TaxID=1769421 RepID=A0ABW2Y5I9_9BIFI
MIVMFLSATVTSFTLNQTVAHAAGTPSAEHSSDSAMWNTLGTESGKKVSAGLKADASVEVSDSNGAYLRPASDGKIHINTSGQITVDYKAEITPGEGLDESQDYILGRWVKVRLCGTDMPRPTRSNFTFAGGTDINAVTFDVKDLPADSQGDNCYEVTFGNPWVEGQDFVTNNGNNKIVYPNTEFTLGNYSTYDVMSISGQDFQIPSKITYSKTVLKNCLNTDLHMHMSTKATVGLVADSNLLQTDPQPVITSGPDASQCCAADFTSTTTRYGGNLGTYLMNFIVKTTGARNSQFSNLKVTVDGQPYVEGSDYTVEPTEIQDGMAVLQGKFAGESAEKFTSDKWLDGDGDQAPHTIVISGTFTAPCCTMNDKLMATVALGVARPPEDASAFDEDSVTLTTSYTYSVKKETSDKPVTLHTNDGNTSVTRHYTITVTNNAPTTPGSSQYSSGSMSTRDVTSSSSSGRESDSSRSRTMRRATRDFSTSTAVAGSCLVSSAPVYDIPATPDGFTLDSVTVDGNSAESTPQGYRVTPGVTLNPGQSQSFNVEVTYDVTPNKLTAEQVSKLQQCAVSNSTSPNKTLGIFNETTMSGDSDTEGYTNNYVCTPVYVKTSIKVSKKWVDSDNQEGKRPDFVKIQLLADGKAAEGKTLELKSENDWASSFDNLDAIKDGKLVTYTVEEIDVASGYKAAVDGSMREGYTVTNTYTPVPQPQPIVPNTPTSNKPHTPTKPTQSSQRTVPTVKASNSSKSSQSAPSLARTGTDVIMQGLGGVLAFVAAIITLALRRREV